MGPTTLSQKTALRRRIDRQWSAYLTASELKVLLFIFTVTTEWGKEGDRIKREHFVSGIGPLAGTGLCEKTVRTALASLEAQEVIRRARTPYGYVMGINFDWKPRMSLVLKQPKKPGRTVEIGLAAPKESGKVYQSRVVNLTTPISKGNTFSGHTSSRRASDDAVQVEGLSSLTDRLAELSARKKAKDAARSSGKIDIANVSAIWNKAYRETFPECAIPTWTKKQQGQVQTFLKSLPSSLDTPPLDVFDWCVRSWRLIVNARFSWMKENPPPEYPAMGFLVAFKDRFYDAWNERERLRVDVTTSSRDKLVRNLVHQGLSREEAQQEVDSRDNLASERQRAAQDRAKLDRMLQRAEAASAGPRVGHRRDAVLAPKSRPSLPRSSGGGEDWGGFGGSFEDGSDDGQ